VDGLKAANGITNIFGVDGAEEPGGRFVAGLLLSAAPLHQPAPVVQRLRTKLCLVRDKVSFSQQPEKRRGVFYPAAAPTALGL
jgi:hypothetical protein